MYPSCTNAGVSAFSNGPVQNGGLPNGPASAERSEASLDAASEPEKALASLQHQVCMPGASKLRRMHIFSHSGNSC